jgi:nitrate/nitrite-specific signal transduction histidine kinase
MNALKHSGALNVWVVLRMEEDDVVLTLRDDGVGFDADAPGPEGHFGLAMMRERALVAGGTYRLESSPGAGTSIAVRFPASWLRADVEEEEEEEIRPPADVSPDTPSTEEPDRPASLPA